MTRSLALLQRADKWYLGSGDGLVWAPPFPAWHDTPGFWDEAHLVQYPIGPLFTISFLVDGQVLPLPRCRRRRWSPTELELHYRLGPGLTAVETRTAPGDRVLASEWVIAGSRAMILDFVLWTAVNGDDVGAGAVAANGSDLRLTRTVRDRKRQELEVHCDYRLAGARSWSAVRSEASGPVPDFRLTPFYDRWRDDGRLDGRSQLGGITPHGLVYAGLARRVRLKAGSRVRVHARVQLTAVDRPVPPSRTSRVAGSAALQARRQWATYAGTLPDFACSDPLFARTWWYRWYGLRLNRIPAGLGQYREPSVAEGIAYFHQPISYSAMCHAREVRWTRTGDWARGVIDTFVERAGADGQIPGRVYLDHQVEADFYHADWGGAVEDVLAVHPDPAWVRRLYPALSRYAGWLLDTRDRERSGMFDVVDQFETGQEYMSRYQAVDSDADRYGWENRLRLKGIDVTVYACRLFRWLAAHAPDADARDRWTREAGRTGAAIRDCMWDPESGMFSDVDPRSGERTGVKAAVCFYPYLLDLTGPEHLDGLARHLFNPGEFWTPFPVPSSSADDPLFSPDAAWKGKRHVCPWNGRVWPMTNSHVVDALARVVRDHRPDWAPRLVHLVRRFLSLMTMDGDPRRPNCFEHYHPVNGKGSLYRGIDDYQHSWVNDLLVRHVIGVLPDGERGFTLDPLPFGLNASLRKVCIAGHRVDVTIAGRRVTARVDGRVAGRSRVGVPIEVSW